MSRIKGLEALFSANKEQFKSKEDCIIAALHCILINTDLLCVGLGEGSSDNDSTTELLPEGWNENQDLYCLRYRDQDLKRFYLLKIVKAGNNLHVNLVRDEDVSSGMTVNTDEFVSETYGKYSETFKALDKLNENFKQNVLNQVQGNAKKSGSSSKKKSSKKDTSNGQTSPIPAKVPIPQVQPIPTGVPDTRRPMGSPLSAMPRIGGNDLDPFGRSEGSMLFDPSTMGVPSRAPFGRGGMGPFGGGMGLPPHAVPPGARFDPFGPPDVGLGGRFNPDPDHFRPPDYDNMFM